MPFLGKAALIGVTPKRNRRFEHRATLDIQVLVENSCDLRECSVAYTWSKMSVLSSECCSNAEVGDYSG
jgi:hypothetical protein